MFGVLLGDRDLNRPTVTEDPVQTNERHYLELIARLDEDQLGAVVDLALNSRAPCMRRALLGPPAAAGDQRERRAFVSALDALARTSS